MVMCKKLSGTAVCKGRDLVGKFAERCGLALTKGYLMIFVMSLWVILDISLNVISCYGHNSSPIPWPGF